MRQIDDKYKVVYIFGLLCCRASYAIVEEIQKFKFLFYYLTAFLPGKDVYAGAFVCYKRFPPSVRGHNASIAKSATLSEYYNDRGSGLIGVNRPATG